ncbi:MAG: hypothetical protein ACRBBW_21315 [Cellvibrionaceae bacterium]
MEYLEQLALKYSQTFEPEQPVPQAKVDTEEAEGKGADRLSRFIVKGHEFGFRLLDGDIEYTEALYKEAEEDLAPLLEKHGLGSGVDSIPFEEEVTAGLFIGRLWRNTLNAIRANAKAKKQKESPNHGEERKHPSTEPAQPVSGEERVRQESNPHPSQWDQANG